jgi:hypothetical protein
MANIHLLAPDHFHAQVSAALEPGNAAVRISVHPVLTAILAVFPQIVADVGC